MIGAFRYSCLPISIDSVMIVLGVVHHRNFFHAFYVSDAIEWSFRQHLRAS